MNQEILKINRDKKKIKPSRFSGIGRSFCFDLVAFILNLFKQKDPAKARNKIKYVRNFIFIFEFFFIFEIFSLKIHKIS